MFLFPFCSLYYLHFFIFLNNKSDLILHDRMLQEKLDQPISQPHGSMDKQNFSTLSGYVQTLKVEVKNLRKQLVASQAQCRSTCTVLIDPEKPFMDEVVIATFLVMLVVR